MTLKQSQFGVMATNSGRNRFVRKRPDHLDLSRHQKSFAPLYRIMLSYWPSRALIAA
jgi:hypothetical protein